MGAPQIIWIVMASVNLLLTAYLHGKPKDGNHNIWLTILGSIIMLSLLIGGGFFK
jgi:hypothetical protein